MKYWNQNTFKYFIAFDLYLMATQALKYKLFFAAVVFFEELLKTTTGSVHFEHLWNTTILYDLTKKQLESAKMIHDYSLLTYGQYGKVHRCNNETFQAKFRDFPMVVVDVSVLDRRQKITDKYKLMQIAGPRNKKKIKNEVNTSITIQSDKLCNGEQIRVSNNNASHFHFHIA